jgi:hypothetical protein
VQDGRNNASVNNRQNPYQILLLPFAFCLLPFDFREAALVSFAEDAKITFFDLDTIEQQLSKLFNRPVEVVTKRAIEQSHNWIRKKNILENAQIIYEQRSRNTTGFN